MASSSLLPLNHGATFDNSKEAKPSHCHYRVLILSFSLAPDVPRHKTLCIQNIWMFLCSFLLVLPKLFKKPFSGWLLIHKKLLFLVSCSGRLLLVKLLAVFSMPRTKVLLNCRNVLATLWIHMKVESRRIWFCKWQICSTENREVTQTLHWETGTGTHSMLSGDPVSEHGRSIRPPLSANTTKGSIPDSFGGSRSTPHPTHRPRSGSYNPIPAGSVWSVLLLDQ